MTDLGDDAKRSSRWVPVAAGVLVSLLAWPTRTVLPEVGLDASWRAGLHLATHGGLQFGKDVIFSYGPYGFLSVPAFFFTWTGYASFLYTALVTVGFATTVVVLGRRSFSLVGAVVLAYLALLLTYFDPAEVAVVVLFLWCLYRLSEPREVEPSFVWPIVGGAFAALQLLVKFNTGIAALLIVGLTLWGMGGKRARNELIAIGSFLGAFIVLWLAASQHLSGIVPYVRHSLQVASGYSAAMGVEVPGRGIEYAAVAFLVIVVVPLILLRGGLPAKAKPIVLLLIAVMAYFAFLHGFIRHDWFHSAPFLILAAVVPVGVSWKGSQRMIVFLCSLIPLVLVAVLPGPLNGYSLRNEIRGRPRRAIDQLRMVVDASYRHEQVANDRLLMTKQLRLDARALALIKGHDVAVDPVQISVIWPYRLDWRPVPIFQTYSAYTSALDELNAAALASSSGPDRVLREGQPYGIDGRYPLFESPAYHLSMICNFADLYSTRRWEVLGRIPDRCSRPSLVGSVRAVTGRPVHVPRPEPGQLIYASIDLRRSLIDRLLAKVFKPRSSPSILLDNHVYRFVAATASGPLVLCIPQAVAPREYGGGVCPSTIAVRGAAPIEIRFYAIQVGPAATP